MANANSNILPQTEEFQTFFKSIKDVEIILWEGSSSIGLSILKDYPDDGLFFPARDKNKNKDSVALIKIGYDNIIDDKDPNKQLIVSIYKSSRYLLKGHWNYNFEDEHSPTEDSLKKSKSSRQPIDLQDSSRYKFNIDSKKFFDSEQNKEIKPSKIDLDKRAKYMSHNLVQLAKMSGEFDGIEASRKRRLEKEPEGFFLNDGKGPYSCGICGQGAYGKDIWWNLDGLRCRNCWKNIKDGVIPHLKYRHDDNTYFEDWQIKDEFGVHPATRAKLKRESILKGRDLKNEKGQVYHTIYLISENQEFLKRYPKKESNIRMTIRSKDGKQIEL